MTDEDQGTPDARPWFLRLPRRWVNRGLLRVVLVAALGGAALAAGVPREVALGVAFCALLALPVGAVEALAEDRFPTARLRLEAVALGAALTLPLAPVALLQAAYLDGVLDGGPAAGYAAVEGRLSEPLLLAGLALGAALPFVVVLFQRLRFGALWLQASSVLAHLFIAGGLLAIGALVAIPLRSSALGACATALSLYAFALMPACVALLVVFRAADRLDRRLRGVAA